MRHISEYVQIERYAGAGTDPKGNDVESWDAAVSLGIYAFDPGSTSEPFEDGHQARVISVPSLLVPTDSVIGARDRVTARGKRYEVDGDPLDYRNPYDSSQDGLRVHLKGVTG